MNRRGELVCCRMCGRDTRRKDAICQKCAGHESHEEERGRKGLRWGTFSDTPMDNAHEEGEYQPAIEEQYHGDSIRDDL